MALCWMKRVNINLNLSLLNFLYVIRSTVSELH